MNVLLHICCGPCAIHPVQALRAEGHRVSGFFYNPNIHPYSEYRRRYEAVVEAAARLELDVVYHRYDFEEFLKKVVDVTDEERHRTCWRVRLEVAAGEARRVGCDAFTTTLLVSPHQDQDAIREVGESLSRHYGVGFLYRDFRPGFSEGHRIARTWELYHQNYCGCVYSEKEAAEARERRRAKRPEGA